MRGAAAQAAQAVAGSPLSTPHGQGPTHQHRSRIVRGARAYWGSLGLLTLALAATILVCTSLGATHIPIMSLWSALLGARPLDATQHAILFSIRLPRVLASAVVGAALAASGLMFQGLFRNPMADPYIIGSSGGAILGGSIGLLFFTQFSLLGFSATAMLAFAGSLVTMTIVYALARTRGRTNVVTLLLAGFAISTMFAQSTYLFEIFDPGAGGTRILTAWLHGVIGVPEWPQLALTSVLLMVALLAAWPLMQKLNTLALGEEYAHNLGMNVERTRIALIVVASLLTAAAVAIGGLISFAGLIVPHIARLLLGPDHTRLLPMTVVMGAIFLVVTDTAARTLFAPLELPVGVLMVAVGGPFFLWLLRRSKRGYAL